MNDAPLQDTTTNIGAQLAALLDYVRQCAIRVERGEVMDLTSLDRTVSTLCAELTVLPAEHAQPLEPQIQNLITALNSLADRLQQNKENAR